MRAMIIHFIVHKSIENHIVQLLHFISGAIGAGHAAGDAEPEAERVEREPSRKPGRARGREIKAKNFMQKPTKTFLFLDLS